MIDCWAVVPVKPFRLAKQRMAGAASARVRSRLARAMLADVLDELRRSQRLAGVIVVTRDPAAACIARRHGAEVRLDPDDRALTPAVAHTARWLAGSGRGGMFVVHGDVPGISAREVDAVLAAHGDGAGLTIVPSLDGRGSNGVLLTPPDRVALFFGQDSCARNLLAACITGLVPRVRPLPGIGLDLDTPDDLRRFAAVPSPTRTWRLIEALNLVDTATPMSPPPLPPLRALHR